MNPNLILLFLAPIVVWRIYARVKRLMVRQQSILWRHWFAIVLFPATILILAGGAIAAPMALATLVGSTIAGAALGAWSLRLTRFENTEQGLFYTPNPRLSTAVWMVFVAGMLYRGVLLYTNMVERGGAPPPDFATSPLTMLVCGLLGGYYMVVAPGLLRRHRAQQKVASASTLGI